MTVAVAVLQIVGLFAVAAGLWMQWPWVGVAVGGALLFGYVVLSDYLHAVPEPSGDS